MELRLQTLTPQFSSFSNSTRLKPRNFDVLKGSKHLRCREGRISSALAETAASIAVAATVVGAAATILAKRNKDSEANKEVPARICKDCEGSGVCSECKGEGFVLKKLSEERAAKARLMAKDAATRYTAGLPKKWSYCAKCSSSRSCTTCGGVGKLSY